MPTETEEYVSLKNIPKITASTYDKPVIMPLTLVSTFVNSKILKVETTSTRTING